MYLLKARGPTRTLGGETIPQAARLSSKPASGWAVVGNGWSVHDDFPSANAIRTHADKSGETTVLRAVGLLGDTVIYKPAFTAVDHRRIRKAKDPNDTRDLVIMMEREGIALAGLSAPVLKTFYDDLLGRLDANWVGLPAAHREAVLRRVLSTMEDRFPAKALQGAVGGHVEKNATSVIKRTATSYQKTLGLGKLFSWGDPEEEAVDWIRGSATNYVTTINSQIHATTSSAARSIVADGFKKGLAEEEIAHVLHSELSGAVGRTNLEYWRTSASTYISRARSYSQLSVQALGGFGEFEIVAVLDNVTCPRCFAPWTIVTTPFGGRRIDEINEGDRVVAGSGVTRSVQGVSIRKSWDWLLIKTSSGCTLTVTPEHPIMTTDGWKKAEQITRGEALATQREVASNQVQELRQAGEGVREQAEGLLLGHMLPRLASENALGRSHLPPLRENIQGSSMLHRKVGEGGKGRRAVLQSKVLEVGEGEGRSRKSTDQDLRDLRADFPIFPRGVPVWQGAAPLLDEVQGASQDHDLRDVREGIRAPTERESTLLFPRLLSSIQACFAARDAGGVDLEGTWNRIRDGMAHRDISCGLLVAEAPDRAGSGRRILARREGAPGVEGEEGTPDKRTRAYPRADSGSSFEEERGERSIAAYHACSTGWDEVVSVERIELTTPLLAYNLEVADDPTYIADGILVHNCRFLHGKRFSVGGGLNILKSIGKLKDPKDIKYAQPWMKITRDEEGLHSLFMPTKRGLLPVATETRSGMGLIGDAGTWKTREHGTPEKMAAANFAPPPFHGKCRCTTIPVFGPAR